MTDVLEQRINELEKDQGDYVLREVFDIFKEELKEIRKITDHNRYTNMKLMGALVVFKIIYAPLIFIILQGWVNV